MRHGRVPMSHQVNSWTGSTVATPPFSAALPTHLASQTFDRVLRKRELESAVRWQAPLETMNPALAAITAVIGREGFCCWSLAWLWCLLAASAWLLTGWLPWLSLALPG